MNAAVGNLAYEKVVEIGNDYEDVNNLLRNSEEF
jgi:hypothetical protein